MEIVYRGIKISTPCKYFIAKEGTVCSLVEDKVTSVLTLSYIPGSTAKDVTNVLDSVSLVGSGEIKLEPTGVNPRKVKKTRVTLNGLVLEKQTLDSHTIRIVIVRDSESRVIQDYWSTVLVISEKDYKVPEFIEYLFYSGGLIYLKPVGPKLSHYELRNFPKLIVSDKDLDLKSENSVVYSLRKRYDDYLIREIDYQDQFVLEIRRILDDYGVELVRVNKEQALASTSYVTYQINQTPVSILHPHRGGTSRDILSLQQPIEFSLHTTDMVLYHDFKKKYTNVDLLTNFCEFKTTDRYGGRWTAAVKWGQITEDFNHTYQSDDNSNFSFQCHFRCDLYYYEVFDRRYEMLKEISVILETAEKNEQK